MEKIFFEYDILLNRTMNDPELAKEILNDFISDTPDLISKLQEAILNKKLTQVISISHELKGSSATIAATDLSNKAKIIELRGRENNLDGSEKDIDLLKNSFNETVKQIQQEVF